MRRRRRLGVPRGGRAGAAAAESYAGPRLRRSRAGAVDRRRRNRALPARSPSEPRSVVVSLAQELLTTVYWRRSVSPSAARPSASPPQRSSASPSACSPAPRARLEASSCAPARRLRARVPCRRTDHRARADPRERNRAEGRSRLRRCRVPCHPADPAGHPERADIGARDRSRVPGSATLCIVRRIMLPSATPSILTGLRLAASHRRARGDLDRGAQRFGRHRRPDHQCADRRRLLPVLRLHRHGWRALGYGMNVGLATLQDTLLRWRPSMTGGE